jgi:hypothetical protein
MKPIPQRLNLVLLGIALVSLMSAVGCENKPAENAAQKSQVGKLPTPPPQVQIGPPGQNSAPPAR